MFSETFEAVFSQLQNNGLKLKASKCEFFMNVVSYLGYIVSVRGVEADPDKLVEVKSWPEPVNVKTLRSFLGVTDNYGRVVKDYYKIVMPLNDILIRHHTHRTANTDSKKKEVRKSSIPWQWGEV